MFLELIDASSDSHFSTTSDSGRGSESDGRKFTSIRDKATRGRGNKAPMSDLSRRKKNVEDPALSQLAASASNITKVALEMAKNASATTSSAGNEFYETLKFAMHQIPDAKKFLV